MPRPYTKRAKGPSPPTTTTTSNPSAFLTITLKPLRASATSPQAITVRDQTPDSSIYDVKAACAAQAGYAPEKVKILWERKPVADTKTVREVVGEKLAATEGEVIEMGVMYMGAPTVTPVGQGTKGQAGAGSEAKEAGGEGTESAVKEAPVAQGKHGEAVLESKEFWDDLQGFVLQRLRDEDVTANVMRGFRESWRASRS